MDPTLIILLLAVVAAAAALYYLYVVRGWYDWAQRGKAGVIVFIGVLAPVLVLTLWQQHNAKDELAAHGISIHPDLGSSIGIATGNVASGTHWAFRLEAGRPDLLDYYREPSHRSGWVIIEDNDVFLILSRDDQRLTISASDDTVIFQLSPVKTAPEGG
ncbi:MAG: hypothetical protein KJP16_01290 [Gammaproteobacteria bacterium]|nr:hypothetical protein [Gammaproteobacteria bacterium]NNL49423.1 hypothetical protein [Woeseiaceae bacterium]